MLLEYLTLVLAQAFGVWFFIALNDRQSASQRLAGPLLLRLLPPVGWGTRLMLAFEGFTFLLAPIWAVAFLGMFPEIGLAFFISVGFVVLMLSSSVARWHRYRTEGVELRKKGIVRRVGGPVLFTIWSEIRYCAWLPWAQSLFVQYRQHSDTFRIRAEMAPIAMETLARFADVRVRTSRHAVETEEATPAQIRDARTERKSQELIGMQFRLSTLMILVLSLSCFFSWVGIRMRYSSRDEAALESMARFQPRVMRAGLIVREISFTISAVKPSDADLPQLTAFTGLINLDLSGSPVTDRGIAHLKKMTSVWQIDLRGTLVTQDGIDDLQRALPRTTIVWTPSVPAVMPPPTPPAGVK